MVACAILFSGACADVAGDELQESDPIVESAEEPLTVTAALREDAYVRDGTYKSTNYGASRTLSVNATSSSLSAFSLFKFNLGTVSSPVKRATLRVYGSANSPTVVEARRTWNAWSEGSVTYGTAPSLGDYYSEQKVSSAAYYTWDVTKWANLNLGNSAASIALAAANGQTNRSVTFNAREGGSNAATLSVETADAAPIDAGSTPKDAGTPVVDSGSSCTPRTCGTSCGTISNGCGGTISCGVCPTPAPSGKMFMGTNFWRHTWGNGPVDYFKPGVNWATTTDPWQPQLLSDLSYAKVLRFMDWGPTNGSKFVSWSQRVPKTADQTRYSVPLSAWDGGNDTGEGVAYEWQIDLANRTGADFWVNIPHAANDDFVLQLARLIQAQLNSGRKVYVEYSNEVWNNGFYQFRYAADQFKQRGLPQNITYQNKSVYIDGWLGYATYRSLQVFDIFEQVFGKDNPRLVKVLASQLGFFNWPDYVKTWGDVHPLVVQHMAALKNPIYNPKGIKVNAYAMAPYWSGNTVSDMRGSVDVNVESMAEAKRALEADGSGIALICYEAGQDGANQVRNASDPAIYQLTFDAFNKFKPLVNGPFMNYTHVGWDSNHAWGLKKSTTSSLAESHKYRATLDWAKQN